MEVARARVLPARAAFFAFLRAFRSFWMVRCTAVFTSARLCRRAARSADSAMVLAAFHFAASAANCCSRSVAGLSGCSASALAAAAAAAAAASSRAARLAALARCFRAAVAARCCALDASERRAFVSASLGERGKRTLV